MLTNKLYHKIMARYYRYKYGSKYVQDASGKIGFVVSSQELEPRIASGEWSNPFQQKEQK